MWVPAGLYDDFLKHMPLVCVDVVIPVCNKYLLVKRGAEPAKGEWWLVGGRLLRMENPEDAVCRKINEELGIVGECRRFITVESTKFPTGPGGIAVHSVNLVYEAKLTWDIDEILLGRYEEEYALFSGYEQFLPQYVQGCIRMFEVINGT